MMKTLSFVLTFLFLSTGMLAQDSACETIKKTIAKQERELVQLKLSLVSTEGTLAVVQPFLDEAIESEANNTSGTRMTMTVVGGVLTVVLASGATYQFTKKVTRGFSVGYGLETIARALGGVAMAGTGAGTGYYTYDNIRDRNASIRKLEEVKLRYERIAVQLKTAQVKFEDKDAEVKALVELYIQTCE